MLEAATEARLRRALGDASSGVRTSTLAFASDYTRMLTRALPRSPSDRDLVVLQETLRTRCQLPDSVIELLIEMAMDPGVRAEIRPLDLRAYTGRFGRAAGEALRLEAEDDLDLEAFADRYGAEEALLMLDSLFRILAIDGIIDAAEIGWLQRAAHDLHIDPVLVSALFRKHDVRHATGDFDFPLSGEVVTIGRAGGCDIQLPDPLLAPRHARMDRQRDGSWRVTDLNSGRPTLLNGNAITSGPFQPGDTLRVGSHALELDREQTLVRAFGPSRLSALTIRGLTRTIDTTQLLDDISFTVFSGEVIAVVGPSGAGKTTLLNAITGIAPADAGNVWLDGEPFHALLQHDPSLVGFVPQDDVLHPELSVDESLRYSARLRFPPQTAPDTIDLSIERVLQELGIEAIRGNRIGDTAKRGISGGQRKRVNLGQELLTTSTRILFLDEPTSGLDPQTSQDIFQLVRQLADAGRIVFIVTHDLSPSLLSTVDKLLVLAPGGRTAWFGPPTAATSWFQVPSADELFRRLPERTPTEWKDHFRQSDPWRKYVGTREHLLGIEGVPSGAVDASTPPARSPWTQFKTLTARTLRVRTRDFGGLTVQMAQAPILALAIIVVFPKADTATLFMLVLSALWFGASSSIRELIAERAIWRRESRVGLRVGPYIASKVAVLGLLVLIQCLTLTSVVWAALHMGHWGEHPLLFDPLALVMVTATTGLVGMSMGLALSSLFRSSEAAVASLPLVLIPQITFGGLIVKVKYMTTTAAAISWLMVTRYAFDAAIKTGEQLWAPATGRQHTEPLSRLGILSSLGFRDTAADPTDLGLPLPTLMGILMLFFLTFLGIATWRTMGERQKT